jgi:hypothetical protein
MYDIVQNPIPKSDIWATLTISEIQDFIDQLPAKERASASHVLMWTLNACHKLVDTEILSRDIFAS